jgi:hypothetical protein
MTFTLEVGPNLLTALIVAAVVLLVRWWWSFRTGRRL